MARRPALVKRKPKTVRSTKSEQYLVNKKHLGDEPLMVGDIHVTICLNWYNYMCTSSDARDYLKEYLKNIGKVSDAKKLSRLSDNELPLTSAWLCRMISRGYKPPGTTMQFISSDLARIIAKADINNVEETENPKQVISIQDRMREKTHDILGEIEGLIDDYLYKNEEFSLYTWMQSNNIPAAYATSIISKLSPVLDELIEAYDGKDEQLKEGYRSYTKSDLKRIIGFYNTLCDDAAKYANVTKKTRAPRKPRVQSLEKKLKSFKYQKEDNTFKIASINPEKIIGSQELWTFNTKYKTLSVFRAIDRGGLDVKGASIVKFDEASSFTLRTGRKPEEVVKKVLDGGKILLRKLDQELKHNATLQSRISESTILLRVVQ
jgi:hypothetical protein